MLTNPKRGDVVIQLRHPVSLDKITMTLRPSFDAIAAIEGRIAPLSVFRLLSDVADRRDISMTIAAAVVWAGSCAFHRDEGRPRDQITYEHAGACLFATPPALWTPAVLQFLTNCVSTPDGREEAAGNLGNAVGGG